jgi:ferredoxin
LHGRERKPLKIPLIDLNECTECESCIELAPEVFRKNPDTGLIEVVDLQWYPEEVVEEAIAICPADCISWEELN